MNPRRTQRLLGALTAAVVTACLLAACKPSVEGEKKAWSQNTGFIKQYGAKYPAFKAVLDQQQKAAQKVFDAASKLKGEKAAEKMRAANKQLREAINPIQSYQAKLDKIERLKNSSRVRRNKGHKVRDAIAKGNKYRDEAQALVAAAKVTTLAELKLTMQQANDKLRIGLEGLERLDRKGRKKRKKRRKKKKHKH